MFAIRVYSLVSSKFGRHIRSVSLHTVCVHLVISRRRSLLSFPPEKKILSQLSKIFCIWPLSVERWARICIATKHTNTSKHSLTHTDSFSSAHGAFDSFSLSPFHSFVRLFGSVAVCSNIHVAGLHFSLHSTVAVAAHHFVSFCSDEQKSVRVCTKVSSL